MDSEILSATLPKDPDIRDTLIAELRERFGGRLVVLNGDVFALPEAEDRSDVEIDEESAQILAGAGLRVEDGEKYRLCRNEPRKTPFPRDFVASDANCPPKERNSDGLPPHERRGVLDCSPKRRRLPPDCLCRQARVIGAATPLFKMRSTLRCAAFYSQNGCPHRVVAVVVAQA